MRRSAGVAILARARLRPNRNRRVVPGRGAAPERTEACIRVVDRGRRVIAIVVVVRPILDLRREPVPKGHAARLAGQVLGNALGIAEGKVEAHASTRRPASSSLAIKRASLSSALWRVRTYSGSSTSMPSATRATAHQIESLLGFLGLGFDRADQSTTT